MSTDDGAPVPVLRVVSGAPSAEEIAALTAVLAVAGSHAPETSPGARRPSLWATSGRVSRSPQAPAPGGWRASGLPR